AISRAAWPAAALPLVLAHLPRPVAPGQPHALLLHRLGSLLPPGALWHVAPCDSSRHGQQADFHALPQPRSAGPAAGLLPHLGGSRSTHLNPDAAMFPDSFFVWGIFHDRYGHTHPLVPFPILLSPNDPNLP